MLEPSGPLPPEIYQRRRMLAIGVAVVALIVLVVIVASLRGGGDDNPAADTAAVSSSASSTSGSSTSASTTTATATESGTATASESPSGSLAAAPVSGSVPAGQCADNSLAIKVSSDQPNYPAGAEPSFGIVVTNIGNAPCDRDLGAGLQQVMVYSLDGQQRLWSNSDCFPNAASDIRTLKPGEQAAFTVKWSGATSEPGCTAQRNPVGVGAYTVVGQLGALRSAPEPFNLG